MFAPAVGDVVLIEEVHVGSHDVLGMTGTVKAVTPSYFVVSTPFTPAQSVDVLATRVRPA
jgi:hypothetical protein